ncbi:atpase aaa : ATPase associated with various cellular activities AAA_5 OS=Isosphaera pallida (strain ATCC 43644 / DSM 9630 / IS1B) GN=Isop_0540 PE=4 SV=1: AAA_5 [Gemmataceae bacterium]|nr:atpase aaa : ATPase associated with various cellular activities AAA_5 OS=Isosphaera pallida (strain ATCC 43644 / DSM 9630 / IS1B) GN=Isop_0540 PE=4 SV=1: AAA_5 [Gemmataceae bacterium]VTT96669.1 atpase aaa : ATPase associated with various cellular activities AAA_5 OS=Isosphaera pallida (strain ATCC 43644 / DSM 9630 / IS1B) GN=Isop_0540 PE=4 SV=1: AAA_5 [Gemmataceae bacterium]
MPAAAKANPEELSLADLQAEADGVRKRITRFRESLGRFFVNKQEIIDLMCVAAVAQEPLLLVGPPGTAKSDLVLKFKDALGIEQADYFEYMLTRFTEPSEIIGAIDIKELRDGRYIRKKEGKLPTAKLVFLDEIFKSNSAILNILLTIINEKKFYQEGKPEPVPLRVLFAATNEIPEQGELAALKDRFVLKVLSRPVQDDFFTELIDAGLQGEAFKGLNQKPWVEGHATLDDFLKANRYLTYLFARKEPAGGRGEEHNDRQLFFPPEVFREYQRLVKTLVREDKIFISDRKLVKLYKLFRVRAWLFSGGTVSKDDLRLLAYLGESHQEIEHLRVKVPEYLGDA